MNLVNRAYSLLADYAKPQGMKIFSLVGLLYLSIKSFNALHSFCRTFLFPGRGYNLPQRYGYGSWALITGAGQGIGAAFAEELAKQGFNLILLDMSEEKLTQLSETIMMNYPNVQIKNIICDFTRSFLEGFFDPIMQQIEDLDISLLVNNVGISSPVGPFSKAPEQKILDCIAINIIPQTILTRRLIPRMLQRSQRSGIINMSSYAAVVPSPPASIYSGTKSYNDFFSRAIEKDIRYKIDVVSMRPVFVATPSLGSTPASLYVIKSEDCAKSALKKLGKTSYSYGHWKHEINGWLCQYPVVMDLFRWHFRTYLLKFQK